MYMYMNIKTIKTAYLLSAECCGCVPRVSRAAGGLPGTGKLAFNGGKFSKSKTMRPYQYAVFYSRKTLRPAFLKRQDLGQATPKPNEEWRQYHHQV